MTQVFLTVLMRREKVYLLPAVVVDIVVDWVVAVLGLNKRAKRAAARAIHNRRAASIDANRHGHEHGQPPGYLCQSNLQSKSKVE